jgi:hypothetical protein
VRESLSRQREFSVRGHVSRDREKYVLYTIVTVASVPKDCFSCNNGKRKNKKNALRMRPALLAFMESFAIDHMTVEFGLGIA